MLGKERRKIYSRKIKGFWEEFSHAKIGLFGLIIVIFFVFVAVFAPWITPYNPQLQLGSVADGFAMPEWVRIWPDLADLPQTTKHISPVWTPAEESQFVTTEQQGGRLDMIYNITDAAALRVSSFQVDYSFNYQYSPPNTFYIEFDWEALPEFVDNSSVSTTKYSLELHLMTPSGLSYFLWDFGYPTSTIHDEPPFRDDAFYHHNRISSILFTPPRFGYELWQGKKMTRQIFASKGEYTLSFIARFLPTRDTAACTLSVFAVEFGIPGLAHGVLGTDNLGHDLFAQLVYGVRISLAIGVMAAVLATTLGVLVGVVAGFVGGVVDEALMRIVDILLCLPVLPLILALIAIYGRSVWYIVIIIGVFGWQGLARMIRSQVLSIRETAFVESATASGGNKFYIMYRHILPNVFPIVAANIVLAVPAAILLEAGLSFIGFGDPTTATWGRMLQRAYDFGAFRELAWWWIIPPGLAITTVCLSFVFLGHAVDEIVNPRLRRRR